MGPRPKPSAIVKLVVAAARCKSPLVLSWVSPIEADVVIIPEASPISTRLAAKLWLPDTALSGAAPVPVLLEYLPYRLRDGTRTRDQGLHMYVAGHGYACIRLDIRGTGDSEGVITGEYTEQEQLDGVAAIEWIARRV